MRLALACALTLGACASSSGDMSPTEVTATTRLLQALPPPSAPGAFRPPATQGDLPR